MVEKWVEAIFDVKQVSDRIMLIKLVVGKSIVTVLSVYATQVGLDDCGDFNGHIGKNADGYHGVNGGTGFGRHNLEGEIILEFAAAHNLVVSNSLFTKKGESPGNITVW